MLIEMKKWILIFPLLLTLFQVTGNGQLSGQLVHEAELIPSTTHFQHVPAISGDQLYHGSHAVVKPLASHPEKESDKLLASENETEDDDVSFSKKQLKFDQFVTYWSINKTIPVCSGKTLSAFHRHFTHSPISRNILFQVFRI